MCQHANLKDDYKSAASGECAQGTDPALPYFHPHIFPRRALDASARVHARPVLHCPHTLTGTASHTHSSRLTHADLRDTSEPSPREWPHFCCAGRPTLTCSPCTRGSGPETQGVPPSLNKVRYSGPAASLFGQATLPSPSPTSVPVSGSSLPRGLPGPQESSWLDV